MAERLIFLLGGARSGKSRCAEDWAREHGERVLYVATAQAFDDDMRQRVARHKADRPDNWYTLEAPLGLARTLSHSLPLVRPDVVLVDCLTMLASNALLSLPDDSPQDRVNQAVLEEVDALLELIEQSSSTWLLVSNEVGMGVVPAFPYGRLFRDALGRANQRVAAQADEVLLLVAGLPWRLR